MREGYSTILKGGNFNMKQFRSQRNKSTLVEKGKHDLEVKPQILESRIS